MSNISLRPAKPNKAGLLHRMQKTAFAPILERYQTYSLCESVEQIFAKMTEPDSFYYLILLDGKPIGGVRVLDKKSEKYKYLSPIFLLPQYQGNGYGKLAIKLIEQLHGAAYWQLDTILEEAHLCRFYESLGYRRTGQFEIINEKLTLVYYQK